MDSTNDSRIEARVNAMLLELSSQRAMLGDRCATFAAANALLVVEVEELKKQIAKRVD